MTKQRFLTGLVLIAVILALPFTICPGSAYAVPFPPQPYPTANIDLDPIEYEVDGTYSNFGTIFQPAGATVTINGLFTNTGDQPDILARATAYDSIGIINIHGTYHNYANGFFPVTLSNSGQINIFAGGELYTQDGHNDDYPYGFIASIRNTTGGEITNAGLIYHQSSLPFLNLGTLNSSATIRLEIGDFNNSGVLDNNGTMELYTGCPLSNSGELNNNVGAIMECITGCIITNEAEGIFTNDGSIVPTIFGSTINNHGVFYNRGETGLGSIDSILWNTGTLHNTGTIHDGAYAGVLTFDNQGEVVNDGQIDFSTTTTYLTHSNTGTYGGSGTFIGDFNNAGIVAPGTSAGTATIDGNYTQTAAGTLAIEIGGLVPGDDYDVLNITGDGNATLAGTLDVSLLGGFEPAEGDSFDVLAATSVSGEFEALLQPDLNGLVLKVAYAADAVRLDTVLDSDDDGVADDDEACPLDPEKTEAGQCGCGVADTDTDGDGTPDCNDNCPNDGSKTEPGSCGCGVADTDTDGDGTPDCDINTSSGGSGSGSGSGSGGCFIQILSAGK